MSCHMGKHRGQSGDSGSVGGNVQETLLQFLLEGMGRAEQPGLGPPSFNNLSGLWGAGAVPSCCYLALG